jgi:hypothetical protein
MDISAIYTKTKRHRTIMIKPWQLNEPKMLCGGSEPDDNTVFCTGHSGSGGDPATFFVTFTDEEIREIVRYARRRGLMPNDPPVLTVVR